MPVHIDLLSRAAQELNKAPVTQRTGRVIFFTCPDNVSARNYDRRSIILLERES